MMRSLYSGISGLKNHQTRMDVIGNNIANVNTVGYKTSRTVFQDIFSQAVRSGTANSPISGGTNPTQIGLGVKLSAIDVLHTPAPIARTDNPFDAMIEGDGMFIMGSPILDPNEPDNPTIVGYTYTYTRAGNFYLDNEGYLVNSDGLYVMGYAAGLRMNDADPADEDWEGTILIETSSLELGLLREENVEYDPLTRTISVVDPTLLDRIRLRVPVNYEGIDPDGGYNPKDPTTFVDLLGFSIGQDGSISVIIDDTKTVIAKISVAMFSNFGGLEKAGNSLYRQTPSSGEAIFSLAQTNGAGKILGGGLEMSNVDLASEFTDMIVTQRGFQANSRIITVSDTFLEELVNLKR